MTAKQTIESRLEKVGQAIGSDEHLVQNVMSRIGSIELRQQRFTEFKSSSLLRRIIMNRFTKLAAAAVIAGGAVFAAKVILHDLARPVYALEQTLEACRNKQQAHFVFADQDNKPNKAAWVEYDADGNIARMRVDLALEKDSNGRPGQVIVWQGGHTQYWSVKDKELRLFDDEQYSAILLRFVRRYDPRRAVEFVQELQRKGGAKIGIEQPPDRSRPIVATIDYEPNTFLLDSAFPPMREVMYIDQSTMLVTSIEQWGNLKDFSQDPVEKASGQWFSFGAYKYDGYDEPFDEAIFDLRNEVGDDVNVTDLMTRDVGLEFTEPNLAEEQMAVATVRAFLESLIAKDYNEATRLRGMPEGKKAEFMKWLEETCPNVVEIISIDKPHPPAYGRHLTVPCTVAIELNGERVEERIEGINVLRAMGHPNRRVVCGFEESWGDLGCNYANVGLQFTEPNLTEEQMAVATVRAFLESLIAKDYKEATRLFPMPEGKKAEFMKWLEETNLNVVEIISIDKPHPPARERYLTVPCTVSIELNGERVEKRIEGINVLRAMWYPNWWVVVGFERGWGDLGCN